MTVEGKRITDIDGLIRLISCKEIKENGGTNRTYYAFNLEGAPLDGSPFDTIEGAITALRDFCSDLFDNSSSPRY